MITDGAVVAAVSVLDEEDVEGLGDLMFYLTIYFLHNCIENNLKIPWKCNKVLVIIDLSNEKYQNHDYGKKLIN